VKKLSLNIDALCVESYETGGADARGTVAAHAASLIAFPCTTKLQTCPAAHGSPDATP
jgi:hypothetical protein